MDQQRILQLRSMPYDQYLQTPEWSAKRDQALERDGYRCRACNSDENLNVHHRTYARRGNEDPNDLTTLCQPCHEHFHKRINQEEIMYRTYNPPISQESKTSKEQRWEDYLIRLLILDTPLYAYVCGILTDADFAGEDTRRIYKLFSTPDFDPKLPVHNVPARLIPTDADQKLNEENRPKELVQVAIRIRQQHLLRSNNALKASLAQAATSGDKEIEKQLLRQFAEIQRQLHTLTTAMRMNH